MSTEVTKSVDVTLDSNEVKLSNTEDLVASNSHCIDIQENESTVEGYKKEYSIVGDGLYASVSAEDAPQWLTSLIDNVVDNAVANGMTDYDLLVQDVRNAIDSIDVARNTFVEQINFDATVNQIIGARLQTLNATLENTYATIVDLDTAVANSEFALSQRASDLQAEFNQELNSRITTVQQAYADADSALASDITALETAFDDQETNQAANAVAVSGLQTYVGLDPTGTPDGTGILSSVSILQKQSDGLVETFVGMHELVNNDMDGDINTNELRVDQWPYALWLPMQGTTNPTFTTRTAYKDSVASQYPVPEHTVYKNTANNTFWEYHPTSYGGWEQILETEYNSRLTTVRDYHIGDSYIRYEIVNEATSYEESYKFVKIDVDTTAPYNTDSDGYSWAVVSDTPADAAYIEALNAYALADGKISQFYAWGGANAPADYVIVNADGNNETIPGNNFKYWFKNSTLYYKPNTTWAVVPNGIGAGPYLAEGDLLTVFDPNTRDYTHYSYNGTSWQQNGPTGVISKSKFFVDLENEVTGPNGHVASSLNSLQLTSEAYADAEGARVENKFDYDSSIIIDDVYYKAGFGLEASGVSGGSGTEADPYDSEFWINAERFKFTNPSKTGAKAPFSIDASGTTPQIYFNGVVNFSNVSGTPTNSSGSGAPTGTAVQGSTYIQTNTDPDTVWVYNSGWKITGDPTGIANAATAANNAQGAADDAQETADSAFTLADGKISAYDIGPYGSTTISGNRITTGSLDAALLTTGIFKTNGLDIADSTDYSNYTGTIIDSDGIRVYESGTLRVKIGNI